MRYFAAEGSLPRNTPEIAQICFRLVAKVWCSLKVLRCDWRDLVCQIAKNFLFSPGRYLLDLLKLVWCWSPLKRSLKPWSCLLKLWSVITREWIALESQRKRPRIWKTAAIYPMTCKKVPLHLKFLRKRQKFDFPEVVCWAFVLCVYL